MHRRVRRPAIDGTAAGGVLQQRGEGIGAGLVAALAQDLVDHRPQRLHFQQLAGEAVAEAEAAAVATIAAAEHAADVEKTQVLDAGDRLDRFGNRRRDHLEALFGQLEVDDVVAELVARLVVEGGDGSFGFTDLAHTDGLDLVGLGFGGRQRADGFGAVQRGLLVGFRGNDDFGGFLLGFLAGGEHRGEAVAVGDFDRARGHHLFLRRHGEGFGGLRVGDRLRLLLALGGDGDLVLLGRDLDFAIGVGLALVNGEVGFDHCGVARLLRRGFALGHLLVGFDAGVLFRQLGGLLRLRHFGAGARGLVGNVAFLAELGFLLGALDGEGLLAGLQVLLRDRHFIVADDGVALLLARLRDLLQAGEAFGVEIVLRIEEGDVGLVELGQRYGFQLEAVRFDVGFHRRLHVLDEIAALLLQLEDLHGGGDRAQAVDELGLDLLAQLLGIVGQIAQRLGCECDALRIRPHADVELGADVDTQPVLGDQRILLAALHLQPQRLEIDPCGGMEDRQHHGAAVEHHLLAASPVRTKASSRVERR